MSILRTSVRLATRSDLPQLYAISEASDSAAHWTQQQWVEIFQTQTPVRLTWIAEIGQPENAAKESRGIGILVAQNLGPEWEVENIAVMSEFRRQGVGTGLLSALLAQAQRMAAERILLEVRASNESAICLYKSAGFRLLARRREYYRNPVEDALILEYLFGN